MDAFIDESWLATKSSGDFFLVVVSVMTTDRRKIELVVRHLKRIPKLKMRSELKASVSPPKIVSKFLDALAQDPNVAIVAAMWQGKKKDVENHEKLYQSVVARCALQTVKRSKRIDLHIDKRYTRQNRQQELEGKIREALVQVAGNIVRIAQEDSQSVEELAAPDFVAWAFTQRYCHNNAEFYNIIRSKVKHFDDLTKVTSASE
jgi:hypothetical protein